MPSYKRFKALPVSVRTAHLELHAATSARHVFASPSLSTAGSYDGCRHFLPPRKY